MDLAASASGFEQSYESCSLEMWSNIRLIRDQQAGVSLKNARAFDSDGAEKVYKMIAEKGVAWTYLMAHGAYLHCAKDVKNRNEESRNRLSGKEQVFSKCAHSSATRSLVLDRIHRGQTLADAKMVFPESIHDTVEVLYSVAEQGSELKAIMWSANAADKCVKDAIRKNQSKR